MYSINNFHFNIRHSFKPENKKTIIWAHGMMSSMESEALILSTFFKDLEKTANIIRYDARSRGLSDTDNTIEQNACAIPFINRRVKQAL